MNKTVSSLLVVGLVAVGSGAAGRALAATRGSPYSGKFVGTVPGTQTLWPITIKANGDVIADVRERLTRPLITITWGSFTGTVDADGLMQCTGFEFIRNSGGGVDTTPIEFKANIRLTDLGGIVGTFGTGEDLVWVEHTTTKK